MKFKARTRARGIIILFFSSMIHSSVGSSQLELPRRQLRQLAQAPAPDIPADNIQLVCSATRYPTACLDALLRDERAQNTSSPQALVELLTVIATKSAQVGLADAQTLATTVVPITMNETLTAFSEGCTEILDLAAYYMQVAHAAFVTRSYEDIRAWLSGALTQSNDCYYGLTPFRTIEFVKEMTGCHLWMTDRGNVTVEHISNALALVDAALYYGPDATLWRAPPESREEQLIRLAGTSYTENFPEWMEEADRAVVFHAKIDGLTPDVTVGLDSAAVSIQDAVDQAPSWSRTRYVIYIKAGVYNETVHIPKEKTNLMFLGDGSNATIITGNLHVGQSAGITTWFSATVAVNGAGFIAKGITFENTAGPELHQAVALRVESDLSAFYECSILGNQDSLYTHSLRQFYKDCTIAGTVDFIFGNSAAVFQTCHILVRPRKGTVGKSSSTSTITAQGRIDPGQETAMVFQNCSVDGTAEYNALQQAYPNLHHVYLGRPWKSYSRTIFIFTYFSLALQPEGWLAWNGSFALDTLLDAEYGSSGPGVANMTQRTPWSSQLSLQQAESFSAQRVLQGDTWLPQTTIPYSPLV